MARMRSVKPEYWADEDLAGAVSRDARLLYIGLWNLADEHGRLRGDPRYIKGQIMPYDDDLDANAVDVLLTELEGAGKVVRYREGAGAYMFLPNLAKHQRLEADKVPSRLPAPPCADESTPLRADESARDSDLSVPRAKDHALSMLHVAGGIEHVAGSIAQTAPRGRAPSAAARIVMAHTDATRDESAEVARRIERERRPKNPTALVRHLAGAGELRDWLAEVRGERDDTAVTERLTAARRGPPCEHGQPGGQALHPSSGLPLCPVCRQAAMSPA